MATTSKIFIESSIFLSFIDRANLNYAKSVGILEFLARQKYHLYTSEIVVLQTFNSAERDLGSTVANDFLQAILESNIEVLYSGQIDFLAGYRYLQANPGRRSSLSSVINANLMQKHGIYHVLTFDFWPNAMGTTVSSLVTTLL